MKFLLTSCSTLILLFLIFLCPSLMAQDSTAYQWNVTSKKINGKVYELTFSTNGNKKWQLYGANEVISDVPSVEIELSDSSIAISKPYAETGNVTNIKNPVFDNASFKVYEGPASFTATITFKGDVPATLLGNFQYTYGKGEEFYPLNAWSFSVPLEGGDGRYQ